MFTSVVTALALAASVSRVAASPVHHVARVHAQVARNYRQDAEILEDYTPYHVRYIALNCQTQHNTTFFEDCCHPLLRTQKLSDRPSKCIPSTSASTSAAAVEPTASTIDEDPVYSDDCDETTSSVVAAPTSTFAITSAEPITSKEVPTATPVSTHKPVTTHAPVTTQAPSTTKVHTSAEPTTSASSGGGGDVHTGGQGTFYTQDGTTGACGIKHGDYDLIVAPDYRTYGDINSVSPLCGKKVQITNTANGKQVTATIADVCPTCKNANSIDMSLGTYDKIGARDTGVLPISWVFV